MRPSSDITTTHEGVSIDHRIVDRYNKASANYRSSRRRSVDEIAVLGKDADAADAKPGLSRTFDVFAFISFGLFALAAISVARSTEEYEIVPLTTGLAWLLPGVACSLLAASATLRFRRVGTRCQQYARGAVVMPQRRQWLETLRDLTDHSSGPTSTALRVKVDGHIRAADTLEAQFRRKLPWPARSSLLGSPDAYSGRFPFAVDLLRWMSNFMFVLAALFLAANTLSGYVPGMSASGTALIAASFVRLLVTYGALVARGQRLEFLKRHHELRSVVTSNDDDLLQTANDLLAPAIDLRSSQTSLR